MTRYIAIAAVLVVASVGCAGNQNDGSPAAPVAQPHSAPTQDPLAGSYYQGDGLGYNLHLTLNQDGTFACQWSGCLGDYGSTSGTWRHDADKLRIKTAKSTGMFDDRPLGDMTIVKYNGVDRLLLDTDADLLKDRDMLPFFSFGRIETEEGRTKR